MTTACSGCKPGLPPNAPPTWGAITRMRSSSSSNILATRAATPCGICVETYTVMSRPLPSSPGDTTIALPSIGITAMRWFSKRPRTTTSAPASGSSSPAGRDRGGPVRCRAPRTAAARRARARPRDRRLRAAGRSRRRRPRPRRPPRCEWSAITAAIASPTNRTLSTASGGRLHCRVELHQPFVQRQVQIGGGVDRDHAGHRAASSTSTEIEARVRVRRTDEDEMEHVRRSASRRRTGRDRAAGRDLRRAERQYRGSIRASRDPTQPAESLVSSRVTIKRVRVPATKSSSTPTRRPSACSRSCPTPTTGRNGRAR